MQVTQPYGSSGQIWRLGDLTSLIKAQLQMNSYLFVYDGSLFFFSRLFQQINCVFKMFMFKKLNDLSALLVFSNQSIIFIYANHTQLRQTM